MFKRSMIAIALACVEMAGAAQAQQATLAFTAIPDEDETRLIERFTQCAKYFESKLGVPVKYLPVKSYPAAVTRRRWCHWRRGTTNSWHCAYWWIAARLRCSATSAKS